MLMLMELHSSAQQQKKSFIFPPQIAKHHLEFWRHFRHSRAGRGLPAQNSLAHGAPPSGCPNSPPLRQLNDGCRRDKHKQNESLRNNRGAESAMCERRRPAGPSHRPNSRPTNPVSARSLRRQARSTETSSSPRRMRIKLGLHNCRLPLIG